MALRDWARLFVRVVVRRCWERGARHHERVQLRTRRLTLRPFRSDDVAAFEAFALARAYRRFLGDHPYPAEFVTNNVGVDGAWVVELNERVVGSVFLGEQLACLLAPSVHGMGIGAEAVRAVINDGFERRGYEEIVARADPDNIASLRALERLGFRAREDGTYRLERSDWQRNDEPR
ncbi:MAG: GNAT family N-acetyltransferase [Actinobacteria bacterium]|nr:MAG: GNAT family N-acetyltransferase [Actinomycetota bacterium]